MPASPRAVSLESPTRSFGESCPRAAPMHRAVACFLLCATATATANHYDTLGVSPDADSHALKAAYKKAALRHHPDRHGHASKASAQRRFEQINEAYKCLSDPEQRRRHDQGLAGASLGGQSPHWTSRPLRKVEVRLRCTLEELGGWRPVHIDLSATELVALFPPGRQQVYRLFLKPGSAVGDALHVPLHGLGVDLAVRLDVRPHPRFERQGGDLLTTLSLPVRRQSRSPRTQAARHRRSSDAAHYASVSFLPMRRSLHRRGTTH